jgi:exonuclease SbcD
MSFGSNLMEQSGVHIARVYNGVIPKYTLTDEYGEVCVHLLPFIKPSNVKPFFDNEIKTYTDAIRVALSNAEIDKDKRNILVTHQFVTGASRSESEEISVGGTDNVDASVFEDLDYVALGHIHGPQNCGSEKIRYCGTPLKYSFSEAKDEKSVTVVELNEKNSLIIRTIPLTPLHDMVEIKGKFEDIMSKSFYENTTYENDYVRVTLTDEDDILDAIGKLRTVYRNILRLDYDNLRTKAITEIDTADVDNKSPYELFSELFAMQNGQEMSQEQADLVKSLIEKIWEDK